MDLHPQVLSRIPGPHQHLLNFFALTLDEVVNFGTNVFAWLLDREPVDHTRLTLSLLLRHELELLDGISAGLRTGCGEPIRLLLRGVLEVHLGLLYIAQADSGRRALAYKVADIYRLIRLARRLDPSTDEGRQAQKLIDSDTSGFKIPRDGHDTAEVVSSLEAQLSEPRFAPIDDEWRRTQKTIRRRPDWFSLFGGPQTLETLAIAVHHGSWYERLYRDWSGSTHASDLLERLEDRDRGRVAITGLRNAGDLQLLGSVATNLALLGVRVIVARFLPEKLKDCSAWYSEEFRNAYLTITGDTLIKMTS